MTKKPITVVIPEKLVLSLNETAKRTGRKKNLLLAASLFNFIISKEEEQEKIIRNYLDVYQT